MKAPDKIYTTPVGTYDTKPIPDLQDNIYIRKDYLLEWLRQEADKSFNSFAREELGLEARYRGLCFEEVIDKLNQM